MSHSSHDPDRSPPSGDRFRWQRTGVTRSDVLRDALRSALECGYEGPMVVLLGSRDLEANRGFFGYQDRAMAAGFRGARVCVPSFDAPDIFGAMPLELATAEYLFPDFAEKLKTSVEIVPVISLGSAGPVLTLEPMPDIGLVVRGVLDSGD